MKASGARELAKEAQAVIRLIRSESSPGRAGPIVVSGVLAEQLAKELGADADPGAVVTGGDSLVQRAEVLVRVIAGDPKPEDEALVREADHEGVPLVLVQLWPQADWTRPFVLSPHVVECQAGAGFPIDEIAARILDGVEDGSALALRVPSLRASFRKGLVTRAVVRSAALAAFTRHGATRPHLTLQQIRMLARLSNAVSPSPGPGASTAAPVLAGAAGVVVASGFAFRGAARAASRVLPGPVANALVAAGGTWALAKAYRAFEAHRPS